MNNIRVAQQLVKIAKSLIAAGDVADEPGDYKNFTGTIQWGKTKGKVENATFSLGPTKGHFEWLGGKWISGSDGMNEMDESPDNWDGESFKD